MNKSSWPQPCAQQGKLLFAAQLQRGHVHMSVGQVEHIETKSPPENKVTDRRRYERFTLTLLGRFMRENKQEHPCKLCNISVGGASIFSPVEVELGERVIAYFDHLGGLEGKVVRLFDDGFAIDLIATRHKKEKLAAQITWLINKNELHGIEERRHERVKVNNRLLTLKLDEGISIECRVLDVSLSGAAIETNARPPLGADVLLGKLRCRVTRHLENGIGLQFLDIQDPGALRRYFD